jgi:hypothetical protein
MVKTMTNPEWYRDWEAIYSACRNMGMDEDAQILMHINTIYKKTGGRVREHLKGGDWKEQVAEMAYRLGFISLNDASLLAYGHERSEQEIMADISIDAHCGKKDEDWSERLLRQKILLIIDPNYRKETIGTYEDVIKPLTTDTTGHRQRT